MGRELSEHGVDVAGGGMGDAEADVVPAGKGKKGKGKQKQTLFTLGRSHISVVDIEYWVAVLLGSIMVRALSHDGRRSGTVHHSYTITDVCRLWGNLFFAQVVST